MEERMANGCKLIVILALTAAWTPRLLAQAAAIPTTAATAAPAAGGLVGLCQLLDAKIKACKAKICACPCGQMITSMTKIANTYSGGMICPPCCPEVKEDDLKKASNTPQGACARITKEEAEAPARRASVRCLAYADCNWYPEAEAALITALRTDRNECVRLEAALVMGTGCCCTRKTIEALTISVSGSKKDGNPPENSPRVKSAAYASLQHCLECYKEVEVLDPLKKPEEPDRLPEPRKVPPGPVTALELMSANTMLAADRPRLQAQPQDPLLVDARQVLTDMKSAAVLPTRMPTGNRSLYGAFVAASAVPKAVEGTIATPPASVEPPSSSPPLVIGEPEPRSILELVARKLRPARMTVPADAPASMPPTGPMLVPPGEGPWPVQQ